MLKALGDLKSALAISGTPRVPDVPRIIIKPKIYTIMQTFFTANITTSSSTYVSGAVNMTLANTPLASSLESVFDAWRIVQYTVRFNPTSPPIAGPPLLTAIDYDDSTAPTSTNYLRAYDTLAETPLGNYVERTLVPRAAVAVYSGAFTSFAQAKPGTWIDAGSPNTIYYGVKFAVDTAPSATQVYEIEMDCVFQFKSVR
jgi:hypothetical protein